MAQLARSRKRTLASRTVDYPTVCLVAERFEMHERTVACTVRSASASCVGIHASKKRAGTARCWKAQSGITTQRSRYITCTRPLPLPPFLRPSSPPPLPPPKSPTAILGFPARPPGRAHRPRSDDHPPPSSSTASLPLGFPLLPSSLLFPRPHSRIHTPHLPPLPLPLPPCILPLPSHRNHHQHQHQHPRPRLAEQERHANREPAGEKKSND